MCSHVALVSHLTLSHREIEVHFARRNDLTSILHYSDRVSQSVKRGFNLAFRVRLNSQIPFSRYDRAIRLLISLQSPLCANEHHWAASSAELMQLDYPVSSYPDCSAWLQALHRSARHTQHGSRPGYHHNSSSSRQGLAFEKRRIYSRH